jgi:hypothetical protein
MIRRIPRRRAVWRRHRGSCAAGLALALILSLLPDPASPETAPANVALHVLSRELLLFSAPHGVWTSVRLDAGESVLYRGADGNVAAAVTSSRAIGFSASLNAVDEIRLPQDESVEQFKVEGNLAAVLTRQRAMGFSAFTGKWQAVGRYYLGR